MTDTAPPHNLLRHTLAVLAYRGGKTLRGAPPGFESFRASESTRTPGQILAHIGDLLDWALSIVNGEERWADAAPLPWEQEASRFFAALARLDERIGSAEPIATSPERLFQGAIADAFTHVGQIAMLRRMAGGPVKGESYYRAEILAGRVGPEQAPPRREFD